MNRHYSHISKDHLGNNRVVTKELGIAEQVNYYYPFGMLMGTSTNGDIQRYKYNGKELDRMNGLDWMDYGARNYDGLRFTTVDPLAHKYYNVSPYAYCMNNPVKFIDPDGRFIAMTNPENPAVEVTFDVRKNGDTFPAVIKNRWGGKNNVLELRNPDEISRQTVAARKGNKNADRTAIQFHTKGATDGCLMSVGRNQIEEPSEEIREDLPSTSNDAQRAFMNDIMEYNKEDQSNNYNDGILVEFKQLYEK